uniref:Uncharacterized protein n=1 Tax=Arundo donax TaxID=35708 RepID=A0A0A9FPI9_ARUDO
MLALYLET